jgi:hypothetical protein
MVCSWWWVVLLIHTVCGKVPRMSTLHMGTFPRSVATTESERSDCARLDSDEREDLPVDRTRSKASSRGSGRMRPDRLQRTPGMESDDARPVDLQSSHSGHSDDRHVRGLPAETDLGVQSHDADSTADDCPPSVDAGHNDCACRRHRTPRRFVVASRLQRLGEELANHDAEELARSRIFTHGSDEQRSKTVSRLRALYLKRLDQRRSDLVEQASSQVPMLANHPSSNLRIDDLGFTDVATVEERRGLLWRVRSDRPPTRLNLLLRLRRPIPRQTSTY